MIIDARKLLAYNTSDLWDILTGEFSLKFDDGEVIETNDKETLYSSYAWDMLREFPETPFLAKHHVSKVLNKKPVGSSTHLKLLGNVMWSVHDYQINTNIGNDGGIALRDYLAKRVYELTNLIYNELTIRLEAYVTSISITDFIEVIDEPNVKKANDEVQPTQQSIDHTYGVITEALNKSQVLESNPISRAVRGNLVNANQVLQCVGPRGFLTDIDSHIFRNPILRGYVMGLRSFHDFLIESRSAAKSLSFSKKPLEDTEYFSRRTQLIAQILRNLHIGDCGSTTYTHWHVKESDLPRIAGKYYLGPEGTLVEVKASDKHLIDKTIKMRTVAHCGHPDPYGICSTCFGAMYLSVPEGTNIGEMCCTHMQEKLSQNVLSTKHFDGSSVIEGIKLTEYNRLFLRVSKNENSYLLSERLADKSVKLIISAADGRNITDIMDVKDIFDLNITRVSEIKEIALEINDKDIKVLEIIDVSLNKRLASMTYPMLEYIKHHGWDVDDKGNYVIDLKNWDWEKEFLTLPMKHFNMADHSDAIAKMLESTVSEAMDRDTIISPSATLVDLFNLVNEKIFVNLAVIEVVLYTTMVISSRNNNYGLPKPWGESGLGVMRLSMMGRSLSAAMAFEGHKETIFSPSSFIYTNRPDHPMDWLLLNPDIHR